MNAQRNGNGDERKLEYIAAVLTNTDPRLKSPGGQGDRQVVFYYNDCDKDAQIVVSEKTIEEAIAEVLGLRKKEGINVTLEQGCSERTAKDTEGSRFKCWVSGLDEHKKGMVYESFPTSQRYTAAVYSPRNISLEDAKKSGSRAVVFYQIDPDGIIRIVVSKGTAEEAINTLIGLKRTEGIAVAYEDRCGIRTIRAKVINPKFPNLGPRYWKFDCSLSPVDPQEKNFISRRWFSYSMGSYRPPG